MPICADEVLGIVNTAIANIINPSNRIVRMSFHLVILLIDIATDSGNPLIFAATI